MVSRQRRLGGNGQLCMAVEATLTACKLYVHRPRQALQSHFEDGSSRTALSPSNCAWYNARHEVSFPRRDGAGRVDGTVVCAACRVRVGDADDGSRRLLLRKSRCRTGARSCLAASGLSQARLVALRVLLRNGVVGRVARHRRACCADGRTCNVASEADPPFDRDRDRLAPAHPRSSRRFLTR